MATIDELRAQAEAEGRVFDPADPYNWKGIAAAQAQTPTPTGPTAYTDATLETDPAYLAWLAQYNYNRTQTEQDSKLRNQRVQADYQQALAELERQGLSNARNLDVNLLERGVFQSGEAGRRREDLTKALTLGRQQADTTLATNTGDIEADRLRALTQLDLDREQQIVASRARIAAAQQTVPGGGGGGSGGGQPAGVQTYNPVQTSAWQPLPQAPGVAQQPYQTSTGITVDSGVRNVMEDRRNTATSLPAPASKPKPARGGGGYKY